MQVGSDGPVAASGGRRRPAPRVAPGIRSRGRQQCEERGTMRIRLSTAALMGAALGVTLIASSASAQTRTARSQTRIPVSKEQPPAPPPFNADSAARADSIARAEAMERARQDSIAAAARARQDSIAAAERAR